MIRKTYLTLLCEKQEKGEQLTYLDKLTTVEWQKKRQLIIYRDKSQCKICKEPLIIKDKCTFRNKTKEEADNYIKDIQLKAISSDPSAISIVWTIYQIFF